MATDVQSSQVTLQREHSNLSEMSKTISSMVNDVIVQSSKAIELEQVLQNHLPTSLTEALKSFLPSLCQGLSAVPTLIQSVNSLQSSVAKLSDQLIINNSNICNLTDQFEAYAQKCEDR